MILSLSKAGLGSRQQPRVAGEPLESEAEGQRSLGKHKPMQGEQQSTAWTLHWAKSKQLLGASHAAQGDGVA